MKDEIKFFVKNSFIFGGISFAYSMIGLLFVDSADSFIIGNPLVVSGITIEHVLGHIFWGGVIGLATLKIRYVFLGSSFAILIDADHLLQFSRCCISSNYYEIGDEMTVIHSQIIDLYKN